MIVQPLLSRVMLTERLWPLDEEVALELAVPPRDETPTELRDETPFRLWVEE
jgi:hypothetical protein